MFFWVVLFRNDLSGNQKSAESPSPMRMSQTTSKEKRTDYAVVDDVSVGGCVNSIDHRQIASVLVLCLKLEA